MELNVEFIFDKADEDIKSFFRHEWLSANSQHFGRDISDEINQPLTVIVTDNSSSRQILGAAQCLIMGNTLRVSTLLVKEEYRKSQGIGSLILQKLENLAKEKKWHKIRLSTSEKHQNIKFYQKNGYTIEATLENDAFQATWYILSRFVEIV